MAIAELSTITNVVQEAAQTIEGIAREGLVDLYEFNRPGMDSR